MSLAHLKTDLPAHRPSLRQSLTGYAHKLNEDGLAALLKNADELTRLLEAPPPSRHHFRLDGLQFFVNAVARPAGEPHRIFVWSEIGYVPFHIESPERRAAVYEILRASRRLKLARFAVDVRQKIHVFSSFDLPQGFSYAKDFTLILKLWQEARPFIQLAAQYLNR